jgi:hypothetical protein
MTLSTIIAERRDGALRAAVEAAEAVDHRSTLAEQVAVEQALDDLDRYSRLADQIGRVAVRREARTYRPGGDHSFLRDLRSAVFGERDALDRLTRNERELHGAAAIEHRDVARTGSSWTFPIYDAAHSALAPKSTRPLADLLTDPDGLSLIGESIQFGRLTTGTAAQALAADNALVPISGVVSAGVTTAKVMIASGILASQQFVDVAGDRAESRLWSELQQQVDARIEQQIIAGSGVSGQVLGILSTTGGTSTTYTSGSPTGVQTLGRIGATLSAILANRLVAPDTIIMSPRRWAWIEVVADAATGPMPVQPPTDPRFVARLMGCDVLLSPSVPTNLGGGTEDRIILTRRSDLYLAEEPLRVLVSPVPAGANYLSVQVSMYKNVVFTAGLQPTANGVISGTGLAAPTFPG